MTAIEAEAEKGIKALMELRESLRASAQAGRYASAEGATDTMAEVSVESGIRAVSEIYGLKAHLEEQKKECTEAFAPLAQRIRGSLIKRKEAAPPEEYALTTVDEARARARRIQAANKQQLSPEQLEKWLEAEKDAKEPTAGVTLFELGMTPLEYAAKHGNAEIVQALLENGADINARDAEGHTALQRAVTPAYNGAARQPATQASSPAEVFAAQIDNGMGSEVLAAVDNGMKPTPQQIDAAVRKALDLTPLDANKINADRVTERFCTVAALLTAGVAPLRTTITYAEEMKNPHLAQQLTVARRQYQVAF